MVAATVRPELLPTGGPGYSRVPDEDASPETGTRRCPETVHRCFAPSPMRAGDLGDGEEPAPEGHLGSAASLSLRDTVRCAWRVARPFFNCHRKSGRRTICLLLISGVLIVVDNALFVVFSYVQKNYTTALQEKNSEQFYKNIGNFFWLILAILPVVTCQQYVGGCIALEWRRELTTSLLNSYLDVQQRPFYNMKLGGAVDNPDQRICQDSDSFVGTCVTLFGSCLSAVITLISFSGVLYSISPSLFHFLLLYASAGTVVLLRIFGVPLVRLNRLTLAQEASLRFRLVRVRENAEAVAFYQGAPYEGARCQEALNHLLTTYYQKLLVTVGASGFQRLYSWVCLVLPPLVIAPAYLRGEVEFGVVAQAGFAFGAVLEGLSVLANELQDISGLGAQAVRIEGLQAAIEGKFHLSHLPHKVELPTDPIQIDGHRDALVGVELEEFGPNFGAIGAESPLLLRVHRLSLRPPGTSVACVIRELSLEMREGESILIKGESGVGKSSLLRAIGGLWSEGAGTIQRCSLEGCFFLPQQPYLCLGSLKQQVLYPNHWSASHGEELPSGLILGPEPTDRDVQAALHEVNLSHLVRRYGLDTEADFAAALSLGEQQRLAFARLLLRPNLRLALVDEATSALDEANESALYALLRRRVRGFISVGHKAGLRKFHSHVLHLQIGAEGHCVHRVERLAEASEPPEEPLLPADPAGHDPPSRPTPHMLGRGVS